MTREIPPWLPRWLYFVGGIACVLALFGYGWFMRRQGLL